MRIDLLAIFTTVVKIPRLTARLPEKDGTSREKMDFGGLVDVLFCVLAK